MSPARRRLPRYIYCRNPACLRPRNLRTNKHCESCQSDLWVAPLFRDRYKIIRILGEGAFGRTYKAEDLDCLKLPCVIKKFVAQARGAALAKAQELFEKEAQRLYELDHPQIPRLYAYFERNGSLYLVQQYIAGHDLKKEVKQRGQFNEGQIIALLQDVLPVLSYVHNYHILHRDIKPSNLMRHQQSRQVVLIDFGGAKQVSEASQITQGTQLFTPGYAAIEQIMGKPNRASDLYSLGATCVRLLTGCFPKKDQNGNTVDLVYDSGNAEWLWQTRLQQQGIEVSDTLVRVLDTLLQPFARSRYQTAEEVLAALTSLTQTAYSPPPPQAKSSNPRPIAQVNHSNDFTQVQASTLAQPTASPQRLTAWKTIEFETVQLVPQRFGQIGKKSQLLYSPKTKTRQAKCWVVHLTPEVALELVEIAGGTFLMGSPETEAERWDYESPQHEVKIAPFLMGRYPITQSQWQAVIGRNPAHFKGNNHPVERVSWHESVAFCQQLSEQVGRKFRLPSEAEWEYACRAGTTTPFHHGTSITPDLANYYGKSAYGRGKTGIYRNATTDVGSFSPNPFGLCDLHGQVWEWCADPWHDDYKSAPTDGSVWLENGDEGKFVLRGGAWNIDPAYCRSAHRYGYDPDYKDNLIGLRVVCVDPS
jgi:formylglycine-generating enzyme required for sulfatase activity/tRNA A-37 threonylcarbamoyl transferase component Bud32